VSNVISCILTYYLGICLSFITSFEFRGLKNAAPTGVLDDCSNMASTIRLNHRCLRFLIWYLHFYQTLLLTLRSLSHASWYTYVRKTNKIRTFS